MSDQEPHLDEDGEDEVLGRLNQWSTEIDGHWGEWLVEARTCFDMTAGHQWQEDVRSQLEEAGKVPVAFNRIGVVIDAVCGAEILGRQEVRYYPRELGDAGVNELLTKGAEWVRDLCDAAGQESEMARHVFVCGLAATETRMDYEQDPDGRIIIECCEAMSVLPDPTARKANAEDARYLRFRSEMDEKDFRAEYPDATGAYDPLANSLPSHDNDPRRSYRDSGERRGRGRAVTVDLWQWYDIEHVVLAESRDGTGVVEYSQDDWQQLSAAAKAEGLELRHVRRKKRRYYEAIVSGKKFVMEPRELPHGKFRFTFATGKRDQQKGVWYGLVRPMMDPQRWANEFFSMVLHIIRTNAKGGIVGERSAIGDVKQFKDTWAKSDAVTVVEDGALSGNRIQPKTPPAVPAAFAQLFEQSITAIRDASGVSPEMMGLVGRDQPGVLEHQRKQAGYGILAPFFESIRRYRKFQGELLLPMMRDLPQGTLVRIAGEDGNPQYAPLTMQDETVKFDVVVDEAPAGPNQKERTWAMFTQMLPVIGEMLTPEMWSEVLRYSPFPESFVNKMRETIGKASEGPDPMEQAMTQAGVRKVESEAARNEAQALKTNMDAARVLHEPFAMPATAPANAM